VILLGTSSWLRAAGRSRHRSGGVLILLLLWVMPAALEAQDYIYSTNTSGTITIFGYTGAVGEVTIPSAINGLPVGEIWSFFSTNVTSVTISDGVTTIASGAFSGCTALTNVILGSGVTNIQIQNKFFSSPFQGCTALANFTVNALNPAYSTLDGVLFNKDHDRLIAYPSGNRGSYIVPGSVAEIGDWAFSGCSGLTSVTMGSAVTSLGAGAFEGCTGLTSITIPDSVTGIFWLIFNGCTGLTNVTLPTGMTFIGYGAFLGCTGLTSLTMPDSVTEIEDFAFQGCIGLKSLTIPNSVTIISYGAFESCSGLRSATIPSSVTEIGEKAFFGCVNLTNVTLPSQLSRIEDSTFRGCTSLTAVYIKGDAPSVGLHVFEGSPDSIIYHLPGTTGWSTKFADRPTSLWSLPYPLILRSGSSLGAHSNGFGFTISWAKNLPVVVEACTNLASPTWDPVSTNTLSGGSFYFSDPEWTNYSSRFYRLRSP
jgi:hypothetical protein